ncbi:hypothetical protein [Leptospira bandrabouensis]|nr:hypothetical protein [Leptospira bandrabouensis]
MKQKHQDRSFLCSVYETTTKISFVDLLNYDKEMTQLALWTL